MENQQGPTVEHMQPCSMLCGSLEGRGVWGKMICVYLWLGPFAVDLKLSQHCLLISYTPIQNKKFENKKLYANRRLVEMSYMQVSLMH